MKTGRWIIALFVTLGVIAPGAHVAQAASDNPYWRSSSNLPLEMITGEWTRDGRSQKLTIEGMNAAGQETTFVGGWITPWSNEQSLEQSGEITVLEATNVSNIVRKARVQRRGEKWSPWFRIRMPHPNPIGGGTWGWVGHHAMATRGARRYEWRIKGELNGLAQIDASIEVTLD
jgi:hypothetical protein